MIKSFLQTLIGTILGVIIGAFLGAFWFLKSIKEEQSSSHKPKYASYSKMYRRSETLQKSKRKPLIFCPENIRFKTTKEADKILSALSDHINEYNVASVADFYNLVGLEATSEDEKWGWNNLNNAYIRLRFNDCYISMPNPHRLFEPVHI